jgi:hypothetical protein
MGCTLSGDPVALRLAVEAERLGRFDLAELLRARHELGIVTYGEPLTSSTPNLAGHLGSEVADCMIYAAAFFERVSGHVATDHDLGRVLRLVPMGIEEVTEAIAMTRADVARRGEAH